MLHEPEPLQPSRKVAKFTDAEAAIQEEFVDRQITAALRLGVSVAGALDSLDHEPIQPEENAGPLGIDWSIT